ncbi:guanine nucleotide-binding protein G(I)/G(S)/G(O) subunit gamma-12a isoform X1 [Channa argus]
MAHNCIGAPMTYIEWGGLVLHRVSVLNAPVPVVLPSMSSKAHSSNNIAHTRRIVHQLRIEASIERIKVSKACADLMNYCNENAKHDPLLIGIPASDNPFKDKKPCTIL